MKKGFFKKATALTLSAAMAMSMGTYAFAATNDGVITASTIEIKGLDSTDLTDFSTLALAAGPNLPLPAALLAAGRIEVTINEYVANNTKALLAFTEVDGTDNTVVTSAAYLFKAGDTIPTTIANLILPANDSKKLDLTGIASSAADGTDVTSASKDALADGDVIILVQVKETASNPEMSAARIDIKVTADEDVTSGGGQTIEGESTVKTPVVRVVVPTNLDFAIDTMRISYPDDTNDLGKKNQIARNAFGVINKSNADVMVSFDLVAELADGVSLVARDDVETSDMSATDKDMYLALLGAKTVVTTGVSNAITETVDLAAATFDSADAATAGKNTMVPFDADTKLAYIDFILKAADYDAQTLAGTNGADAIGAFTIYSELNTYADWKPGDVKISGIYNLRAISAATITLQAVTDGKATNGKNQYVLATANRPTTELIPAGVNAAASVGKITSFTAIAADGGYKVFLKEKPAAITSMKNLANGMTLAADTNYTYDAETGIVTVTVLPPDTATVAGLIEVVTAGGNYRFAFDIQR